jgi:hypothetical protein
LQLDARSRVRMPCAGSDRATNTRSIETGLFLTPRLAPTLRPSCGGVQAACAAAVDASSRRSVLVAATTVALAGLFAECEGQHGVISCGRDDVRARSGRRRATDLKEHRRSGVLGAGSGP